MKQPSDSQIDDYTANEDYSVLDLMNYRDSNNAADEDSAAPVNGADNSDELRPEQTDTLDLFSPGSWMNGIRGHVSITDVTIPGTHDTCATKKAAYAQCQTLSIPDQLAMGIRFLDIRCHHCKNEFPINHGPVYQDINFHKVLQQTTDFLKKNPSEFIIMSVKEEHNAIGNTRSFEETLKAHLSNYSEYLYLGRDFPSVSQVRGKIVLLSRYASNTIGLNARPWRDDATFEIPDSRIRVQDEYRVSIFYKSKMSKVAPILKEANSERARHDSKANWLYINFCSGWNAGWPTAAQIIAGNTNAELLQRLANSTSRRYGIIVMDYPCDDVVNSIIRQNGWIM